MKKGRLGITFGMTAGMLTLAAAPAFANWTSYMSAVGTGFQSRRWSDQQYSQVLFNGCASDYKTSTHIDLRQDRKLQPDRSWGVKRYSGCFHGKTSNGEWHNLAKGKHFFQVKKIDDGKGDISYAWLSVSKVRQDTTAAD